MLAPYINVYSCISLNRIKRGFKKPTTFDVDKFMKQKRRGVLFAKIVRAMHNARETEVPQDATSTESDTEFVRAARRMVLRRGNLQVDPMERFWCLTDKI